MVGFFAEHKVELPSPECGQNVCLQAQFGVQGNMINGANCTLVLLGMNTALSPDDFERPPLNMAIAVDVSGSMGGQPIEHVRLGLLALAAQLDPKDTVTLIKYNSRAELVLESSPLSDPDRALLKGEILGLAAEGGTNIYDGLRMALEAVDNLSGNNLQNRVILLSDGVATQGITDSNRIINLGASYGDLGIGITTIGVGSDFDLDLMRSLSQSGAGNFYFTEDIGAVEEVFIEEIKTFMVPLAEEVNIRFETAGAYKFKAVYGTREWAAEDDIAEIYVPAMFMASRQRVDDIGPGEGRRGGGGMMLMELVPSGSSDMSNSKAGASVGTVLLDYRIPGTQERVTQEVDVINPLKPGETPLEGAFDSAAVEKGFVALNIFAGFRMATERAEAGSPDSAMNVLRPLIRRVERWNEENEDVDIKSDLEYLKKLEQIIIERGASTELVGVPPNPWPRD